MNKNMEIEIFHIAVWKEFLKQKSEGKRSEIEFLRSALWFAEVKRRLRAPTTYKVGKTLEPNAFRKDSSGNQYHSNLYSKYRLGRNTPCQKRIELAEKHCPGTSGLINHVLWDVLKTTGEIKQRAQEWLRTLSPDVQTVIFKINPSNLSPEYQRRKIGLRELKMIRRRSSIDALACLTIFLKEAHETRQSKDAFQYGGFLYDTLLMLCVTSKLSDFMKPLIDIYASRIFSLISHEGLKLDINVENFVNHTSMLMRLTASIEVGLAVQITFAMRMKIIEGLLSGHYGHDFQLSLSPKYIVDIRLKDNSQINYERLNLHNKFATWTIIDSI